MDKLIKKNLFQNFAIHYLLANYKQQSSISPILLVLFFILKIGFRDE